MGRSLSQLSDFSTKTVLALFRFQLTRFMRSKSPKMIIFSSVSRSTSKWASVCSYQSSPFCRQFDGGHNAVTKVTLASFSLACKVSKHKSSAITNLIIILIALNNQMFDYGSLMALKDLIAGEEDPDIVENPYKGSMLNPGAIGAESEKKQVARPNAKIEAKIGEKYQPKAKKAEAPASESKPKVKPEHQIWSEQQVADLPVIKHDPRKQPNFQSLYRQKVGTEDVFLGLSGSDPSSNCCQEVTYKIQLPGATMKDIQIDLNDKQMVIQTKDFYLCQYFQYKTDPKHAKAKFISDKYVLELILPIIRNDDF